MDLNLLPTEILEKVLSYLPFNELLDKSLVCRRWNHAASTSIVRQGQLRIDHNMLPFVQWLSESDRNYLTISYYHHDTRPWATLLPILEVCAENFTPRRLEFVGILEDHLDRLYQVCSRWFEHVETLTVLLDDRFTEYLTYDASEFRFDLPKLKHLEWNECLYGAGNKTVTINAPNLRTATVDDSLDATAILRIPNCEKLVQIKCMLFTKHFSDTFTGSFPNLHELTVDFANENYDISFISCMPNLRKLELSVYYQEQSFQDLQSIRRCSSLENLRVCVKDATIRRGSVDLTKMFDSLRQLKQLELVGLNLKTSSPIQGDHLTTIKLKDAKFHDEDSKLRLIAPRLKALSLPIAILSRTDFVGSCNAVKLHVDLGTGQLKESFDQNISPFLQQYSSIQELTLLNPNYRGAICYQSISSNVDLRIQRLELRTLRLSLDFFHQISKWESLKHLSLIGCTIDCRGVPADTVCVLPQLKSLLVDFVKLNGSNRDSFPVVADGTRDVVAQWIAPTMVFRTKDLVHRQDRSPLVSAYELGIGDRDL